MERFCLKKENLRLKDCSEVSKTALILAGDFLVAYLLFIQTIHMKRKMHYVY